MWNKIKKGAIKMWYGNNGLGVKYDWSDKITMIFSGCLIVIGLVKIFMNLSSSSDYIGWVAVGLMGVTLIVIIEMKATEKRLKEILKNKNAKVG